MTKQVGGGGLLNLHIYRISHSFDLLYYLQLSGVFRILPGITNHNFPWSRYVCLPPVPSHITTQLLHPLFNNKSTGSKIPITNKNPQLKFDTFLSKLHIIFKIYEQERYILDLNIFRFRR